MPERDRPLAGRPVPWLALIVTLSAALRLGAALYLGSDVTVQPGTADQLSYHLLALRVLSGHGFSFATGWWPATPAGEATAHWSYLYVLFLAAIYAVAGPAPLIARLLQAVLVGVLQPWLTFRVASRIFGVRVGLASSALVAGYAYFIYYAGALMTESLFFVALLWALDVALQIGQRGDARAARPILWVSLGAAVAAAVLLRQVFLLCVPVIVAWVAWRTLANDSHDGRSRRDRVVVLARGIALTLLVLALAVLPWTARNFYAFRSFVLLNTNAGFAFYWGNHPIHGRSFMPILPGDGSLYGELLPDDLRGRNEADLDRALLRRGVDFVIQDPGRYVALSMGRLRELVKFWPSADSDRVSNLARVLSFGVCAPLMLIGLAVAVRDRSRSAGNADLWLVLAVALVYSLVHVLTWTLVRYRLPVDALLLPLAAVPLVRLADRLPIPARKARRAVLLTDSASS